MANIETNDMLTTAEAAELLGDGTLPITLQKHCQRKVIQAIKLGHSWLIPRESLQKFKESRRGPGRPPSQE